MKLRGRSKAKLARRFNVASFGPMDFIRVPRVFIIGSFSNIECLDLSPAPNLKCLVSEAFCPSFRPLEWAFFNFVRLLLPRAISLIQTTFCSVEDHCALESNQLIKSSDLSSALNLENFSFWEVIISLWPVDPDSSILVFIVVSSGSMFVATPFLDPTDGRVNCSFLSASFRHFLFSFFIYFVRFSFGSNSLTLKGLALINRLMIAARALQPTTTDLLATMPHAGYSSTFEPDCYLFKNVLSAWSPGYEFQIDL